MLIEADRSSGESLQELEGFGSIPSQAIQPDHGDGIAAWFALIEERGYFGSTGPICEPTATRDTKVLDNRE